MFSPVWIPALLFVFIKIIRLCTMFYLYQHDEEYRRVVNEYGKSRRQATRTLKDRLKEMQEERTKLALEKLQRAGIKKEMDDSEKED